MIIDGFHGLWSAEAADVLRGGVGVQLQAEERTPDQVALLRAIAGLHGLDSGYVDLEEATGARVTVRTNPAH